MHRLLELIVFFCFRMKEKNRGDKTELGTTAVLSVAEE